MRDMLPLYRIALAHSILSIQHTDEDWEASLLKWGLVPSRAKDVSIGAKALNARGKRDTAKPSFREAFKRSRASSRRKTSTGGKQQPYFFLMRDECPFGFAGLWEKWRAAEGQVLETCATLTTEANEVLRPVHGSPHNLCCLRTIFATEPHALARTSFVKNEAGGRSVVTRSRLQTQPLSDTVEQ